MKKENFLALLVFFIVPLLAGVVVVIYLFLGDPSSALWCLYLVIFYSLIAFAGFLVWLKRREMNVKRVLVWYGVQLGLSILWFSFFILLESISGFDFLLSALFLYILIIFVIPVLFFLAFIITTVLFFRVRRLTGWLMVLPLFFALILLGVFAFVVYQTTS